MREKLISDADQRVFDSDGNAVLDALVVGRERSLFADDIRNFSDAISARIAGARILVVGGGGSIGAVSVRLLLAYRPNALHVVDCNENYLVELVRNIRGSMGVAGEIDFRTLPLDYGSGAMGRFLSGEPSYDVVFNFAALKHVRSEKDVYSLLQMIDTNLVRHRRFLDRMAKHDHGRHYFAVSTDKAANPTSLMGATKRVMEDLVFSRPCAANAVTTSARFANVAFSNGSLLQGFLKRLAHNQPIAAPRDTARYFISGKEAGELCILSAAAVPDHHVAFPRIDATLQLQSLESVAIRILGHFGLTAEHYDDEDRARRDVERLGREGRWPLLMSPRDTSGEKEYEEFLANDETQIALPFASMAAIRHRPSGAQAYGLFDFFDAAVSDPDGITSKADIVSAIDRALGTFRHVETGRNLDERM